MSRNSFFRIGLFSLLALSVGFVGSLSAAVLFSTHPLEFGALLSDPVVRSSLWFSLWTSIVSAGIAMGLAVPVGYALSRFSARGVRSIRILLDLPLVLPPLVTGLGLLILFSSLDWIPTGTESGPGTTDAAVDLRVGPWAVVLAQLSLALPLAVRRVHAAFDTVPKRLEKMARTLGLGEARTFVRVSIPLARNGLLAASLIVWAKAIVEFGPILVFAGAIGARREVLSMSIFEMLQSGNFETAVGLAAILVLIAVLVLAGIARLEDRVLIG